MIQTAKKLQKTSKDLKIRTTHSIPMTSVKMVHEKGKRKKVNFMIDGYLVVVMNETIPEGERSDFMNKALEKALIQYRREKAFQAIDELRERLKLKMTTAEMIRLKNYGRP